MKRTLTLFILALVALVPIASAAFSDFNPEPYSSFDPEPYSSFNPEPFSSFDPEPFSSFNPEPFSNFNPETSERYVPDFHEIDTGADTGSGFGPGDAEFDPGRSGQTPDAFFNPEDLIDFGMFDGDTFGIGQPAEGTWDDLNDQTITQGSPDNTKIYPGLPLLCNAPGDKTVELTSEHEHYDLAFDRFDLVIRNLDPAYVGTETITVTCNGIEGHFQLSIIAQQHGEPAIWKDLKDQYIEQSSNDGTIIYPKLALQCTDADDPVRMQVISSHTPFDLAWSKFDLAIKNLDPGFVGKEVIELDCNGVRNSFTLHVLGSGARASDFEENEFDAGVFIGSIRTPGTITSGQDVNVAINVKNHGDGTLDNLKITATIQELALRDSAGPFDLKTNRHVTKHLHLMLPDELPAGEYLVRITIHNNDVSRVVHRPIIVEY